MENVKEIFHVHTWRCGHAEKVDDESYVKRALELGANRIVFTDHAPFPGDPFFNRMKMSQMQEYIAALTDLKEKYSSEIAVVVGLEVEYLPSFKGYISDLHENKDIDILVLGQHFYERSDGLWSFALSDKNEEWEGLAAAQEEGISTNFFDAVAHPDRIFRRCKTWTEKMKDVSKEIIELALNYGNIHLEKNIASMGMKRYYWHEFWDLVPESSSVIVGCDAHYIKDLKICNI